MPNERDILAEIRALIAERGCVPRSVLARAGEEIARLRAEIERMEARVTSDPSG